MGLVRLLSRGKGPRGRGKVGRGFGGWKSAAEGGVKGVNFGGGYFRRNMV